MDWGELRQTLTNWASRIVRFTSIGTSASDGSCTVAGRSYAGGPEAPSIKARLGFPFGIRSRPPSGVDATVVHAAGAVARGVAVAHDSKKYGPDDLEDGETALYGAANAKAVLVNKDAAIEVTATPGQPITIKVSGAAAITLMVDAVTGAIKLGPGAAGLYFAVLY